MTQVDRLVSAFHCVIAISELHTAMYGGGAAAQFSGGPPNVGFEPSVAANDLGDCRAGDVAIDLAAPAPTCS